MIHIVFNRPTQSYKVFDADGSQAFSFEASGDAWGDGVHAPYGHDYPIPPGHYVLTSVEAIEPPSAAEGATQIYVNDLDDATLSKLVAAGKAAYHGVAHEGNAVVPTYAVGSLVLPVKELAHFGRSEVMNHGGGSNAPDPLAPDQVLCKTYGCTRLHNADLAQLAPFVQERLSEHTIVFSVVGDPAPLPN